MPLEPRPEADVALPKRAMDDKTLNLWRQIEGARRVGKRQAIERTPPGGPPGRQGNVG